MTKDEVQIKDGGRLVTCRIVAKSLTPAHRAHVYADANPPIGYVLLRASIARRKRGGKLRFLRLNYQYTGKSPEPPMEHWEEWDETLKPEQKLAKGLKIDGADTTD